MNELVWYAAYGSNLNRDRFLCYLSGGRPGGAARTYEGCADTSPPLAEASAIISHRLYFAGRSSVWQGAVAFVETTPEAGVRTHARLYLVTRGQFEDIHDQDNRTGTKCRVDLGRLAAEGVVTSGDGWYDTFVYVGERDGHPVATFTTANRVGTVGDLAAPSGAYMATMARGLAESHGLGHVATARYLAAAPGADLAMSESEVMAAISVKR